MFAGICFAFDDTLCDRKQGLRQALWRSTGSSASEQNNEAYANCFIHHFELHLAHCKAYGLRQIIEQALKITREQYPEANLARFNSDDFVEHWVDCSTSLEHAEQVLARLAQFVPLFLVSNGPLEVQYRRVTNCGLLSYFEAVAISGDVGAQKPHRALFDHALRQLNVKRNLLLHVGDSLPTDFIGAKAAGLQFCWLNNKNNSLVNGIDYSVERLDHLFDLADYLSETNCSTSSM